MKSSEDTRIQPPVATTVDTDQKTPPLQPGMQSIMQIRPQFLQASNVEDQVTNAICEAEEMTWIRAIQYDSDEKYNIGKIETARFKALMILLVHEAFSARQTWVKQFQALIEEIQTDLINSYTTALMSSRIQFPLADFKTRYVNFLCLFQSLVLDIEGFGLLGNDINCLIDRISCELNFTYVSNLVAAKVKMDTVIKPLIQEITDKVFVHKVINGFQRFDISEVSKINTLKNTEIENLCQIYDFTSYSKKIAQFHRQYISSHERFIKLREAIAKDISSYLLPTFGEYQFYLHYQRNLATLYEMRFASMRSF